MIEAALVPVLVGVTQVAKMTGLPVRFAPLFTLVVGVVAGTFLGFDPLTSIVTALASCGLFSGYKATIGE